GGGGGGAKPLNNQSLETKNPKNTKSLDSKSKTNKALESQNPNKIQTTKIQSSKASKDLVNPQSQKVVESNPKLDSKNTRESKKIQRVKNTCDSITIQNPTNSQKSKESSKAKSFIRTIPVSIALASALSSQAVALSTENGQLVDEVIMSGSPTLTVNGTIKNGTIINGKSTIKNNNPNSTNRGHSGGSIINGWDLKYSSFANYPGYSNIIIDHSKDDSAGGVLVTGKFDFQYGDYGHSYEVLAGTKAGNLTFDTGASYTILHRGYVDFINIISVSENASAAIITNKGTITQKTNANIINLASNSTTDAIVNSGTITSVGNNLLTLRANATLGILQNSGTMSTTNTNLVDLSGGNNSIERIELSSGSTTSARTNIINAQSSATIGTITATGATMSGNINLAGTSSITNGISLDNQSKMTGGITLGGSSNIAGIFLANASTITGNVTLNGSSSIDNISISGNNASLAGNITIGTAGGNTASIDNITISNGGTYAGTIHTRNQTSIDSITIASGGVVGSSNTNSTILSSGNSTIHNIDIQDGGTMYGNIEAHWIKGANNEQDSSGAYKDGNIGDVSIAGRLQGDIVVYNKVVMDSLTMSENGTITGSVRVGNDGDSSQTPTLSTITLNGNSGINAIVLGNSNGNGPRATINSLTLEGTSSIGTITNNSNATIVNLTLNETSTITNGITNDSNIGSLDLQNNTTYSGTGSITNALDIANNKTLNANTNGIKILFANNATGTINNAGIISGNLNNQNGSTIKTFNTGSISGSIINNADATIETLNVTGNVANGIRNDSNIGSLIVKESVSYSGNGSITNKINVESGDTLTIGSGTLNFVSTNGTINNAGTINGNITNIANSILTDFTNSGSISGTFTNKGHIVEFTNNENGIINNFVNDNTISFFENNGTIANFTGSGTIYGVINSKTITNDFINIATSLKNTGIITGNVQLMGNQQNCTDSVCQNLTSDLINDGTITGNVTNDKGKEINSVENTGTIGGSIANSGSINIFEVSGTIAQGILNDTNASISSITINKGANLGSNGITNNSNIGTFIVKESVNYKGNGNDRITQALEVAQDKTLTIGNSGTLSFKSTKGSVNNAGTIAGNLSNVKDSIITSFNNSGTITGNLYNDGHIDTLSNT
ncbi:beta strand repeat-containing protein, partial [Helicobacter pullorum]|uniref:beta strand repeat-containing protein n=1 Tax=Helicobacter pullorum TaxID=35818 RepID=UPI0014170FAF